MNSSDIGGVKGASTPQETSAVLDGIQSSGETQGTSRTLSKDELDEIMRATSQGPEGSKGLQNPQLDAPPNLSGSNIPKVPIATESQFNMIKFMLDMGRMMTNISLEQQSAQLNFMQASNTNYMNYQQMAFSTNLKAAQDTYNASMSEATGQIVSGVMQAAGAAVSLGATGFASKSAVAGDETSFKIRMQIGESAAGIGQSAGSITSGSFKIKSAGATLEASEETQTANLESTIGNSWKNMYDVFYQNYQKAMQQANDAVQSWHDSAKTLASTVRGI